MVGAHPGKPTTISLMFYGNLSDPANREFLSHALERFRRIFGPSPIYADDNVILFRRILSFRREPRFRRAWLENARNRQERSLDLRLNTLTWAADHALGVAGDFVECGVWRGFCSAVIADYVDFASVSKTFYLYDTFAGIPPEMDSEGHDSPLFREAGLYESVVQRFARYPNVRIVKGPVPDSFAQAVPRQVAFLHLDMNSSKSEIAALDVLFERISPGGIVVFDDYGWTGYQRQHWAEKAYMESRGHRILELPSGQGLLVKRGPSSVKPRNA
jgi:O-methyltransferase